MNPAPDYDVEKVAAYAKEKGVYLISHNETGGNYLRFEAQLERSLDWAQSLGIHGLKTGYAGGGLWDGSPRHGQAGVRYTATVYGDAPDAHWDTNPTAYEITTSTVTCEDILTLRLAPGGGAAVSFLPE